MSRLAQQLCLEEELEPALYEHGFNDEQALSLQGKFLPEGSSQL